MNQTIDVSGLSTDAIRTVESLVNILRSKKDEESPNRRDPEGWSKALREWAASHPTREIVIDDSRETIYGGRGE
jgi:hypothetical protein